MDAHRPCPDSALLAAFLDGTLSEYERTAVVSHLAECPECRAVALTVVEFQEVDALDALWERRPIAPPPEPLFAENISRWSREKTRAPALAIAGVAAILALAVPVALVIQGLRAPRTPQQALTTLIDVAAAERPLEARLTGASVYAPPPGDTRRRSESAHLQLVTAASAIRTAYVHDYRAPSRRALGIAALVTGELDEAITTLEIASAAAPDDLQIANDLAAAYYERAQRADRPDDLPAALSVVERVLAREPGRLEALFNRALVISALGLRDEARAAWDAYIARDGNSPWTTEARTRLQMLPAPPSGPGWESVRDAFDAAPDARGALAFVRDHTSAAHHFIENVVLARWIAAEQSGHASDAHAAWTRLHLMADAFSQHVPDHTYRDTLRALERAQRAGPRARADLVAAHAAFAAAMRLIGQQRYQDAAPVLSRAHDGFSAIASPYANRARIELATLDYFGLRFARAGENLAGIEAVARANHYGVVAVRAAWITGLVAFAVNDFSGARASYEAMFELTAVSGDVDQWLWAAGMLANLHETLGDAAQAWRYRVNAARRVHEAFSPATPAALFASAAGDAALGGHHAAALLFQSALLSSPVSQSGNFAAQLRAQRARSLHALGRSRDADTELHTSKAALETIADGTSRSRVEADALLAEAEILQHADPRRSIAAAERALNLPIMKADALRRARLYLTAAETYLAMGQLNPAAEAVADGLSVLDTYRAHPSAEFAIRASDPIWRMYARASDIALQQGDVARAFEYNERGRVRTLQERRAWGAHTPSLEALQGTLAEGTAIMVLTQLDDRLHLWLIRRDEVVTRALTMSPGRAAALVTSHLHELVLESPRPVVSSELYELLVTPVAHGLRGIDQLIVVADAPYNHVAFAGLWDAKRQRYFVEDRGVVVAPSATAYAWARKRPLPRELGAARASILAAAAEDRYDGAVGRGLRDVYEGGRLDRPAVATPAQFAKAVDGADVVHVEATLVPNAHYPGLSTVVFDEEPGQRYSGRLLARNVGDAATRARLVVFERSASTRGLGSGEGVLSFARALIAAGVPAVVSSLADTSGAAMTETWLEFHRHYAAGHNALDSLRRAQLEALTASNRRPGPWATLTVFGSAQ